MAASVEVSWVEVQSTRGGFFPAVVGAISEIVDAIEAFVRARGLGRIRSATVNVGETFLRPRSTVRLSDEAFDLIEGLVVDISAEFNYVEVLIEDLEISFTDIVSRARVFLWTDYAEWTDYYPAIIRALNRLIPATVELAEAKIRARELVLAVAEGISNTATRLLRRGRLHVQADALQISAALTRAQSRVRPFVEELHITWTRVRARQRMKKGITRAIRAFETHIGHIHRPAAAAVSWIEIQVTRGWLLGLSKGVLEALEIVQGAVVHWRTRIKQAEEAIDLIGTLAQAREMVRGLVEGSTIGSTFYRVLGQTKLVLANVSVSETKQALENLLRLLAETVQAAEVTKRVRNALRYMAETLDLAETRTGQRLRRFRHSASVSLSEVRLKTELKRRVRGEQERASETRKRLRARNRYRAATVRVAETRKRLFHRARLRLDNLQGSETTRRRRAMARLRSEAISLAEVLAKYSKRLRRTLEHISTSEARLRVRARLKRIAASVRLTETRRRVVSLLRLLAANLGISEGRLRPRVMARLKANAISLAETKITFVEIIQLIMDGLTVVESSALMRALNRLPHEIVRVVQVLKLRRDYIRPIAEIVREIEHPFRVRGMHVLVTEAMNLIDGAIGHLTHIIHSLVMGGVAFTSVISSVFRAKPAITAAEVKAEPTVEAARPEAEPVIRANIK